MREWLSRKLQLVLFGFFMDTVNLLIKSVKAGLEVIAKVDPLGGAGIYVSGPAGEDQIAKLAAGYGDGGVNGVSVHGVISFQFLLGLLSLPLALFDVLDGFNSGKFFLEG